MVINSIDASAPTALRRLRETATSVRLLTFMLCGLNPLNVVLVIGSRTTLIVVVGSTITLAMAVDRLSIPRTKTGNAMPAVVIVVPTRAIRTVEPWKPWAVRALMCNNGLLSPIRPHMNVMKVIRLMMTETTMTGSVYFTAEVDEKLQSRLLNVTAERTMDRTPSPGPPNLLMPPSTTAFLIRTISVMIVTLTNTGCYLKSLTIRLLIIGLTVGLVVTMTLVTFTVALCPLGGQMSTGIMVINGNSMLELMDRSTCLMSNSTKPGVMVYSSALITKAVRVLVKSPWAENPLTRQFETGITTFEVSTQMSAIYRMALAATPKLCTSVGKVGDTMARPSSVTNELMMTIFMMTNWARGLTGPMESVVDLSLVAPREAIVPFLAGNGTRG